MGFAVGTVVLGQVYLQVRRIFPANYNPTNAPSLSVISLITRDWYNGPISGGSTKGISFTHQKHRFCYYYFYYNEIN
jgi:hypothetical protein